MNNMFNNENYMPYGATYGTVYPNQVMPQPKNTQPLTKEDQKELQRTATPFTTQIDPLDLKRSWCTHRDEKGSTLNPNPDGTFTCAICGTVISLDEYDEQDVIEISQKYLNLLNNIKAKYLDIPVDIVKEFFQIMPYVERTHKLYKLANDNYGRYVGYNQNINPALASPNYHAWNSFDMIHGGGYSYPYGTYPNQVAPQQVMPQPQMGYGYPQQFGYQASPMSTMGMQQNNMVMGGNPLYAQPQAPVQMNQPQQVSTPQPAQVQQNTPVQPQQNHVPANDNNSTVTTTASVAL